MRKSVLILGSSGRFGRHAADAFWNAGWAIHTFDRSTDNLEDAARDMDVIVAAWNPLYTDWAEQVLPLHRQIQTAAKANNALVIIPSNVYVYAPDAPLPWGPDTAHNAQNPLGRIRIEMEQSYRDSGVQTVFLRAGDFMDTERSDSWLDKVILNKMHKGQFVYPGQLDVAHSWAWLPDLARAAVSLADHRSDLKQVDDVCFEGYTLTGNELCKALTSTTGLALKPKQMSWSPLHLARPFWPLAKHLLEMKYLWNASHHLDGTRLRQLCPDYRDTPLQDSLAVMASGTINDGLKQVKRRPVGRTTMRLT
ncbi:MAG: epimerase [Roseovarius sp.]|nr:epimerase [Roseovarius sp.]